MDLAARRSIDKLEARCARLERALCFLLSKQHAVQLPLGRISEVSKILRLDEDKVNRFFPG